MTFSLEHRRKLKEAWQHRKARGAGQAWNKGLKTGVMERDKRKDILVAELGFTILRLKEKEILDGSFTSKVDERLYVI